MTNTWSPEITAILGPSKRIPHVSLCGQPVPRPPASGSDPSASVSIVLLVPARPANERTQDPPVRVAPWRSPSPARGHAVPQPRSISLPGRFRFWALLNTPTINTRVQVSGLTRFPLHAGKHLLIGVRGSHGKLVDLHRKPPTFPRVAVPPGTPLAMEEPCGWPSFSETVGLSFS